MRIAQIVLPGASWFERKSQEIDRAALAARHEVIVTTFEGAAAAGASVAHVYAPSGFTPPGAYFPVPYVASAPPRQRRLLWRKVSEPRKLISPVEDIPEAVDDAYFSPAADDGQGRNRAAFRTVGSFGGARPGILNMVQLTLARIRRFREDVDWVVFDGPPTPADLTLVDAWADPATAEDDYDGCVAEAMVASKVVVASRTAMNTRRLDKGMSGFLVPPRDPNELTHAILTALFKSEVALKKIESARQTAGKYRPRQRLRALEKLYDTITT